MHHSMLRSIFASLLLLPAVASVAPAQDAGISRSYRLLVDNDLFAVHSGKPNDHDYTHGTRLTVASSGAPRWLRAVFGHARACDGPAAREVGCLASSFTLAQEIYTPRLDGLVPVPGERPYSGWLAATTGMHFVRGARVRSLRLEVGVTGPSSFAEEAQDGMHSLLGERERRGWAHQLDRGAGFALSVEDRLRLAETDSGRYDASLSLEYGAAAGTVRTAAHFGLLSRIGVGHRTAWSPSEMATTTSGVYLIAAARQYFVLKNVLVEGGGDHPGAVRLPVVQEATLGIGARRGRLALEYRHVLRGREYQAQEKAHAFGSVAFTIDRL